MELIVLYVKRGFGDYATLRFIINGQGEEAV